MNVEGAIRLGHLQTRVHAGSTARDGACYPVTHVLPTVALLSHAETLRTGQHAPSGSGVTLENMPENWFMVMNLITIKGERDTYFINLLGVELKQEDLHQFIDSGFSWLKGGNR